MIGRVIRAALAEFGTIRRTPAALSTMVAAVLVYAVFYPQPYLNEAVRDVPTAVIDQDGSTTSRELIRRIDAGEGVKVVAHAQDMPEARAMFMARQVSAIVVIPPDFERDLLAGRQSPIAAYGDAGYFLVYRQAIGAVGAAARSIGAQVSIHRLVAAGIDPAVAAAVVEPMRVTLVTLFNPEGGYASYVVPAALVLILQQTLLMGIVILGAGRPRRRASANADANAGARVSTTEIIASLGGKAIAYTALYSLWAGLYLLVLPHVYTLPRLGAVADIALLVLPFLLAVSFFGLFLAALMPSAEIGILMLVVLGLPLFFLAGVAWPAETIPRAIHIASELIPSSSAIRALVEVNQMGAAVYDVRDEIIRLWLLAGLYAALGCGIRLIRRPAAHRLPKLNESA